MIEDPIAVDGLTEQYTVTLSNSSGFRTILNQKSVSPIIVSGGTLALSNDKVGSGINMRVPLAKVVPTFVIVSKYETGNPGRNR